MHGTCIKIKMFVYVFESSVKFPSTKCSILKSETKKAVKKNVHNNSIFICMKIYP